MIPVSITHVSLSNMGFVVFLKSSVDERTLPIFIGAPEAQSIAFVLDKVELPRPLTHDLFKTVLDNMECRLKRVEVCDLQENTFYARIIIEHNGMESSIDARPSDAIALGLRCSAPILVADEVMTTAGVVLDAGDVDATDETPKKKRLSHEDELKHQLANAIEQERYEDAARIRDDLKKLTQTHLS